MPFDERLAQRVRDALAARDDVVEKRMFGGVAFLLRGHMACGIVGSTLMVRLAPEDAERYLHEPHVRPMDFTGRPMRGFLYVDPPGSKGASRLRRWVARAVEHAEGKPEKTAAPRRARRRTRAAP